MRTQLQLQGIVLILFGMLLVLTSIAAPATWGILHVVFIVLGLLSGILGVALSLSKSSGGK